MTEQAGSLLRDCLSQLPAIELAVFKYIVNHLSRVAQHSGMIILRRDIKGAIDLESCKLLYVQNWGQIISKLLHNQHQLNVRMDYSDTH